MTTSPVLYPDTDRQIGPPVRLRLLGCLSLAGAPVPSARQMRRAFALLALHPGAYLSVRDLARELWGDDEPRSWRTTVQTYVMRLRRDHGVEVETRNCGYALSITAGEVDALRYMDYVDKARRMFRAGDARNAKDTLTAAQSLWLGRPLEDVECGPLLEGWVERIEAKYHSALMLGFAIALQLGGHRDVVDDLWLEWRRDRCKEDVAALLMAALYRCHRQVDALKVFNGSRDALSQEYGVEPGSELRGVRQQILAGDRALELEAK